MSSTLFDLEAGALCLDFANTVDWHASDQPQDKLRGYSDLLAWGQAAGIVSAARAEHLGQLAGRQELRTTAAFAEAVRLRETIYRIFFGLAGDGATSSDDLTLLNEALSRSLPHWRLISSPAGFIWDWRDDPDALDQILWPIARSAADLLISKNLDRVRQCADDRGCGYLFIDMSRNRSRRWCSMEACGNRAKARRHYRRTSATT